MYTVAYLIEWWTIIYNHASTCFDISNYNSSLLSIHLQFQNATKKMKLKLEIQSDVGSVVTESCTKRGQKGVSFSLISIKCRCVFEIQIYLQYISDLISKFSITFFFTVFHYVLPKESVIVPLNIFSYWINSHAQLVCDFHGQLLSTTYITDVLSNSSQVLKSCNLQCWKLVLV